ncbi:helix-turn-helix domain-containing protein [Kitasatospora xanthocidica]|uniref:helix-turn-helix domain-containing protein n=1 Tax=Kitasatospora xanthocidica TaxID=83382 RepID=UPI0036E0DA6A
MSFLAVDWALEHSPVNDPYERLLLTVLARKANSDGTDAYPSRNSLAMAALCDKSTVTRRLKRLEARGIIREGDQRAAFRIPKPLRPKVYDILIPFSFFSPEQLAKVNEDRADRGLGPLTAEDRPPLAPAPPRKPRVDKGTKRSAGPDVPGGAPSTPGASSTPRPDSTGSRAFDPGASSTGVLEVLSGGASSTPTLSSNSVHSSSGPFAGQRAVKKRKKTGTEGGPGGTADPGTAPGRFGDSGETAAEDAQVQRIVAAWTNARKAAGFGPHRRATALRDFTAAAATLVRQGRPVNWLIAVATWMGTEQPSWVGLGEATKAQYAGSPAEPGPRSAWPPISRPFCGDCDEGWVYSRVNGMETADRCACTSAAKPVPSST